MERDDPTRRRPLPTGPRTESPLVEATGGGAAAGDPPEVGRFLRRRGGTIAAGLLATFAVVALLTWLLPETYHSSASFLVERREGGGLSTALEVLDRLGTGRGTATEIELIRSRRVLEPVVEELALHVRVEGEREDDAPLRYLPRLTAARDAETGEYRVRSSPGGTVVEERGSGRRVAEAPAGAPVSFAGLSFAPPAGEGPGELEVRVDPFLQAVSRVQERISVAAANPDADVVQLTCEGRTAAGARDLCAAVADSYLRLRASLQRAEANAAAEFLAEQVEQARTRLLAAEDELRAYEGANRVVALPERASEGVRRYAALRAQREELDAERRALAEWIREMGSGDSAGERRRELASFPTFFREQNQVVTQLLTSLVELENRRGTLRVTHTERTPEIAAIDARVEEIEGQLRSLATSYEQALGTQIRSLDRSLELAGGELDRIPNQQIESARLERKVSLLEDLYRFLETRLHEAEVAQAVNLPSVRIIDEAALPFEPSWPNVPLNLGLGLFLGLVTGLGAALYQEHTDRRLRERAEVERATGVAVLGMIPRLRDGGPVTPVAPRADGWRSLPEAPDHEREVAREAFRSVLADLRFLGAELGGREPRCIAITSASRGEGKTFTACNLALTCAAAGGRTVVVDADWRASGVARFFDLPPRDAGLTDLLAAGGSWEEVTKRLELDGRSTLEVLPAGTPTLRSASLLESPAFEEVLDHLRQAADYVIVDTPPLNVLSDAAVIASRVDAVVVVVRGGMTERDALQHTLRRLSHAHSNVVGIVLNDAALPAYYTSYSHAT